MKVFASFALSLAVVLGAALSSPTVAFGCGGSSGQTGCRVVTSPVLPTVRFLVTLFDALLP